jgi:hypothetical protein
MSMELTRLVLSLGEAGCLLQPWNPFADVPFLLQFCTYLGMGKEFRLETMTTLSLILSLIRQTYVLSV